MAGFTLSQRLRQQARRLSDLCSSFSSRRRESLLAVFYAVAACLLLLVSVTTWTLYIRLLSPSETSEFADFRATGGTHRTILFLGYGCDVSRWTWRNLFNTEISKVLANYVTLARILLSAGTCSAIAAVLAFFLSIAFQHFSKLPRAQFANPGIITKGYGFVAKHFRKPLRFSLLFIALCVVELFILIHGFGVCSSKMVQVGTSVARIQNCRRWVKHCARDTRRYGNHLSCQLHENFRGFPATLCETDDEVCWFPSLREQRGGAPAAAGAAAEVEIFGGLCAGETLPAHEGGPLPQCPMCQAVRADPASPLYNPSTAVRSRRVRWRRPSAAAAASLLQLDAAPAAAAAGSAAAISGGKELPATSRAEAFTVAYFKALTYAQESSAVARALSIWALSMTLFLSLYYVATHEIRRIVPRDGSFARAKKSLKLQDFKFGGGD